MAAWCVITQIEGYLQEVGDYFVTNTIKTVYLIYQEG